MYRYYYKKNAILEKDCDDFLKSCETMNFFASKITNDDKIQEKKNDRRKAKLCALNAKHLFARVIWSYMLEFNYHFKLLFCLSFFLLRFLLFCILILFYRFDLRIL